jgi:hypothetical protein
MMFICTSKAVAPMRLNGGLTGRRSVSQTEAGGSRILSTDAHLQFSGRVITALISLCMAVARGRLTRLGGAPVAAQRLGWAQPGLPVLPPYGICIFTPLMHETTSHWSHSESHG